MTKKLFKLLEILDKNLQSYEQVKPAVSAASIGWHIEHALLTIDRVIERLKHNDPKKYKGKLSFLKIIIFATKTIPRGKARSPEVVKPNTAITKENLSKHISATRNKILELKGIDQNQFFEHPYFGHLKLRQAIKFLEIHTNHHLKIVKDIQH